MANLRWCVARRNLVLIKQPAHTRERSRRMRLHGPVGKAQRLSGLRNVQVQHEPARKNLTLNAGKPTNRSNNRVTLDHSLKLIDGGHCHGVMLRRAWEPPPLRPPTVVREVDHHPKRIADRRRSD